MQLDLPTKKSDVICECSPGGIHMFTLFNDSAPSWNLILFALLEVVLISWAYGVDKFLDHLEDMIPHFSPTAKVNMIHTYLLLSIKSIST